MNTIEGNKLIAIFMGGKLKPKDRGNHPDNPYNKPTWWGVGESPELGQFELQYHSSWDWLMPVVEKIECLKDGNAFQVNISCETCEIEVVTQYAMAFDIDMPENWGREKSKIHATWEAVIQFIQWYNQQKQ